MIDLDKTWYAAMSCCSVEAYAKVVWHSQYSREPYVGELIENKNKKKVSGKMTIEKYCTGW